MTHRRIAAYVFVGCAPLVVALALGAQWVWGGQASSADEAGRATVSAPLATATHAPTATASPGPTPIGHAGLIDGVPMTDGEWGSRQSLPPLAVMVDNAPPAVPQHGLGQADLVYEALVEGGLTRFMAVYWRREATRVEPIRSARTPFVVWAAELGAIYAHAGGAETSNAANAIGQIKEWSIADLDALLPATAVGFYRDGGRPAPYNLAAGTEALRKAASALGYPALVAVSSWRFKADFVGTGSAPAAAAFELSVGSGRPTGRLVQWHWDRSDDTYLRSQWGAPHIDAATGQQLRFKTVVVMRVPWSVIDAGGHVVLAQIGEGPAHVMIDGRRVDATWRKASRTARTRFFDADGVEVSFNRGPVFIEVIGPDGHFLAAETPDGLPTPVPGGPGGSGVGPRDESSPEPQPTLPSPSATPPATGTPAGRTPTAPPPSATPTTGPSVSPTSVATTPATTPPARSPTATP